MTESTAATPAFDPDAVHSKYLAERDKRLVAGRADIRDLRTDEYFACYRDDPFTPLAEREPVADEVDVVIVGGGIAGLVAGAELRKAGVEKIRIIDQAGGVGGTWYWNRYPGVMCDVESYIYMPMLEELGTIPARRYAWGEEILEHLQAIAKRYDLESDALFHTGVTRAEWDDDAARWRVHTDRGDLVSCRWYVLAVMCAAYALSIADRYVVSTVLEPIRLELKLTDGGVAFLSGFSLALFYITLGIPISWIPSTWVFRQGKLRYAMNYGELRFPMLQQLVRDSSDAWEH